MNHGLQTNANLYSDCFIECLTTRLKGADLDAVRQLVQQPDFDWDIFLSLADEELISPLLFEILQGQQIAPPAVEEVLARKHNYIARRNLFLLHELDQTISQFKAAGQEVIVLKGAALVETVYKNIALRPMRDLDLLVRYGQLAEAPMLLAPLGYEQTSVIERNSYPIGMEKPGIEPVILELHWSLFHSLYYQQHLSMDWFWETTNSVKAATQTMTVLGHEAQVLHLCGHMALHHLHEPQMLWLNDLAELLTVKKDEISWDLLLDKAQTFHLILPLRQFLLPIAQKWGAPIPAQALQELERVAISAAETQAYSLSTTVKRSEGQGYWRRLGEISGWHNQLAHVLNWFFPSPISLRSRYHLAHPLLLPLAYLYHWGVGVQLGVEGFLTRFRN